VSTSTAPRLVPVPRQVRLTGGWAPAGVAVRGGRDPSLPPQGYALEVTATAITVLAADEAGERYAAETLRQLRDQYLDRLPALTIRDWPDFQSRGVLLSVSQGRVPTMAAFDRLVDVLRVARINQLQLYFEHTFAYADHEAVWSGASPMTPAELRALDDRCAANGIELVANQNCFTHLENWLAHQQYRHLAETVDGFDVQGVRWPPSMLRPGDESARFALGLLEELLPNLRTRHVNIGCDEPFELGRGASANEVARRGPGEVYLEHVLRLMKPLVDNGYRVQFWADVVRREPRLRDQLPDGAVAIPWLYEAPQSWGLPDDVHAMLTDLDLDPAEQTAGFAAQVQGMLGGSLPFVLAPGTSSWNSLVGRLDNAKANLVDAVRTGTAAGAEGILVTDWGDGGHLQPPSVSFGPVLYGGAIAWCADTNIELDLVDALDRLVFGDASRQLGEALHATGQVWRQTGVRTFNSSPLSNALVADQSVAPGERIDVPATRGVVDRLTEAIEAVLTARPTCPDGDIVQHELVAAIRLARHGAWRLLHHHGAPAPDRSALRGDLEEAIELHRGAWMARSRPGGFRRGLEGLERVLASYGR
jgi:hexosaminidase